MLAGTFKKILFSALIFYSSQLFAEDFDIEISGNVQSGYKLYDHYSFSPYFDQDSTQEFFSVARINLEGDIYNQLSYELHVVQAYDYSNAKTGVGGRSTSMLSVDLSDNWINDVDRSAHSYIDRANIKFSVQDLDIQVGRLATSFGKPTFWNLFDYYGSSYLGQEYKAGIDALKIDKAVGNFSGVTVVFNEQNILTSSGSYLENTTVQSYQWLGLKEETGFLLRGYTNYQDIDYALLYKREPEGHRLGLEIDGELGSFNIYDEITYLWDAETISMPGSYQGNLIKNYFMNVLGASYHFDNELQLTAEHLFNGIGDTDNLDASDVRYKNGVSTSLNNHLSAILLSYELTPLLMGRYDSKYAWADSSNQHNFSLTQSIAENTDLVIGGQINIGSRPNGNSWQNPSIQSEFGRLSNALYIELKHYF
jgi:hypothetical protein